MSNYPPPQNPQGYSQNFQQVYVQPQPSNGLGVAGFIVSLIGIFTAEVLSPIGMLLSFFALFKRPRGFAVAGFIIGLLGTVMIAAIVVVFGLAISSFMKYGTPYFATISGSQRAQMDIETWRSSSGPDVPPDLQGNVLIATERDGWGHPFRYRAVSSSQYQIISAGPDGIMGNGDDIPTNYPGGSRATSRPVF